VSRVWRDRAEVPLTAHSKNVEPNAAVLSWEWGRCCIHTALQANMWGSLHPPSVKLAPSYCLSPPNTRFFASLTSKQRWNPLKQTDLVKNKPSVTGAGVQNNWPLCVLTIGKENTADPTAGHWTCSLSHGLMQKTEIWHSKVCVRIKIHRTSSKLRSCGCYSTI